MDSEIFSIKHSSLHVYPLLVSEAEVERFPVRDHCPACGGKQSEQVAVELGGTAWTHVISVVQCGLCDHIYYLNPPDEQKILAYYADQWRKSRDERAISEKTVAVKTDGKMANLLAELAIEDRQRHILDVGCAMGNLLQGLKASGYEQLWGCEQNRSRGTIAADLLPGRVSLGGYSGVPEELRFDVIYSHHVVEHIYEPANFIAWAKERLAPDGVIAVFVPDAQSETSVGQALFLPHLHSFNVRSLEALGKWHGLEVRFWKGCRPQELCAVFFKAGSRAAFEAERFATPQERDPAERRDLLARLRGPWLEAIGDGPVYVTWHISSKIKRPDTLRRSYVRLNGLQGAYLVTLRRLFTLLRGAGLRKLSKLCFRGLRPLSNGKEQVAT